MKLFVCGGAIALFALAAAMPSVAKAAEEAGTTCLKTYLIDHTDVRNERTIVFHMKGGKTWVNTLATRCPGLRFNGFEYVVRGPAEVCSNRQAIRVLKTGSVCMLGTFTPSEAKPASESAPPREY
jgi:hypothetical protein